MTQIARPLDTDDFEIETALLAENLSFLKTLSLPEFVLYKKWDEIRHCNPPQPNMVHRAKNLIWRPDPDHFAADSPDKIAAMIAQVNAIRPKVVPVGDSKTDAANFQIWESLCCFISSAEKHAVPARMIRFLIIDDADPQKRIFGIAAIGSDMNNLGCRDEHIGWTAAQKNGGKLRHTAVACTVVPTQPFGFNFLGGKLVAALLTTQTVRDEWESRYGNSLSGLTTTSLYGSPSQYDRIPYWRKLGYATGNVLITPDRELYHYWRRWLARNRREDFQNATKTKTDRNGPATGEKLHVLNLILKAAGLSPTGFKHGFCRGVYFCCLHDNTRPFLCEKVSEKELVLKPCIQQDVEGVMNWWRPRAIQRYLNLLRRNELRGDVHWYGDLNRMDYETAKSKYLPFIGGGK